MMVMLDNKLNWGKNLFKIRKHRRNITGWNISGIFKAFGRATLVDGSMCIWLRNKKMKRIGTTIQLRRYVGKDGYYANYPFFFSIGYKFKRSGYSYAKIVKCSRLVIARQKW